MPNHQPHATLAPCDTSGRRGGSPTLLLAIATLWLVAMAALVGQDPDTSHAIVPFVSAAVLMAFAACGSWAPTLTWDQIGRFALWFGFGSCLSMWMFGIFGFGWFFLPALLIQLFAIITWPRDDDHPIVDRSAIGAEILGFFAGPMAMGLTFFVA